MPQLPRYPRACGRSLSSRTALTAAARAPPARPRVRLACRTSPCARTSTARTRCCVLRSMGFARRPSPSETELFERFTDGARRVVVLAQDAAQRRGHGVLASAHLLLAILEQSENVGA